MNSRGNVNGEHNSHPNPNHRPYPTPPHHHHPSYHPRPSSSASFRGCCCCLFLLLTFLALLLVAVVLVVVLAIKPKKPQFDLQQVNVQYIIVAPSAAATAAYLSLNLTMIFTAVNPNKVGIKYSPSAFYIMYKGVPLGLATVPGFYQPAHSRRTVETRASVDRVNVLQQDALELVRDATLNDRVELRVTGDVGAKIRIMEITSPRVKVAVDCAIVISPRKQSLTYKQCGVDGLSV
ncbi:uncharacterized protein LOC131242528 [Magnolia sinica]|uniref:uncharacterized protein LOC131242528 n=1 Tax=Magnolia sinica TaxID=86752 RepID=UPI002659850D|nr:uncharacterized protein LOC131242528 [Magnolia sinica]